MCSALMCVSIGLHLLSDLQCEVGFLTQTHTYRTRKHNGPMITNEEQASTLYLIDLRPGVAI
jgi:hypothetical protein